ncbi:thiamine monophosphate kinase [Oceanobacillus iheyensis HTE831]|uniref:Thiamine-monophosphate kinase n=1 Tax=Oceanobacillus iheyensis (strain DSM 14371 / CIP 107618 / JCM 11309 / KCTC 3954 / HTE831) TaxID=221109 RepID=Q8ESJ0_OCEIH|nr:thiamine-phosphate kinase [Oceanobacillus iheyensis]BAC12600.1 thiamine monophosphate kinase [Oceanobacillus iheyensis HTE831]
MDEFSFIDSIKPTYYRQPSLLKGIGDDAAVFRSSKDIVTAVDTFVEDVHFSRSTMEPYHIGYRALGANISDLAAMGASPSFYLVSIVIPKNWTQAELSQIYSGMDDLASKYHMDIIGGDTVSGKQLTISITVIGYTITNKARYRQHAKEGDIVFVTGTLGDSLAGFHILTSDNENNRYVDQDFYIHRHRKPEPRVAFAQALESLDRVSLNDVSDGIANEASEIAEASNVSIVLRENDIPVAPSFYQFTYEQQYQWKLSGGEDFELLGTVAKGDWAVVNEAAEKTNTQLTVIGSVVEEEKHPVYIEDNAMRKVLKKSGYTHLK